MLIGTLIAVFVLGQNPQAQLEFSTGGGVHGGRPALASGVGFDAVSGDLGLGLFVPFVVTIERAGVHNESRLWDTPSDYAHAIRYLSYRGSFGDARLGFRVGETHDVTLGFGGVVRHMNPLIHMDAPCSGIVLGFTHERLEGHAQVDDAVSPRAGGFSLTARPWGDLFLGGTLFADPRMPLSMTDGAGHGTVDQELGVLEPYSVDAFVPLSLFAGYRLSEKLSVALEGITLDASDREALGLLGHLKGRLRRGRLTLTGSLSGGGGGDHFQPFVADSFYLLRREAASGSGTPTLLAALRESRDPGFGMAAELGFSYSLSTGGTMEVKASFLQNRFAETGTLEALLVLPGKLILAFVGALDSQKNGIFSFEGRIALTDRWFLWGRAKRLFAISPGNDYYESRHQILAGIGYRQRSD